MLNIVDSILSLFDAFPVMFACSPWSVVVQDVRHSSVVQLIYEDVSRRIGPSGMSGFVDKHDMTSHAQYRCEHLGWHTACHKAVQRVRHGCRQ